MISEEFDEGVELVEVSIGDHLQMVHYIRQTVFVEEQGVDPDIEFDEFENSSVHYLLFMGQSPVGCGRYRWDGKRIKLERFALLKGERGKDLGRFIMERILSRVLELGPEMIYLHSQTGVKGFYEKMGFIPYGVIFKEADIDHIRMYYPIPE